MTPDPLFKPSAKGGDASMEPPPGFTSPPPLESDPPAGAREASDRAADREYRAPNSRDLPASEEAEQHVIACCLLDGDESIARSIQSGLTPKSFYLPANEILFRALTDLPRPVSLESLAQHLRDRSLLDSVGGFSRLHRLLQDAPTTARSEWAIQTVREKHLLREAIKTATGIVESAYSTTDLDEFLQVSEARISAIRTGSQKQRRDAIAQDLATRLVRNAKPPEEPQTRLFLANKPICTPGNITTLISKAKTGKTAALGAATAAIIAATDNTLDRDTFKFRSTDPAGQAVIVIDTEQSPFDAYTCYRRTLTRAGTDQDPPYLLHYSLVGMTVPQLHEALDIILADAQRVHKGVFLLILDGVADFVTSVNDEVESNGFVTWLRQRTVQFNCPAICVIHSNEAQKAGDDGRGHLGKQLIRKAESNLLLKKEGQTTTITSDKQRKAPITEDDGVAFRWDDEHEMHRSSGPDPSAPPRKHRGRPPAYDYQKMLQCVPDTKAAPLSQVHRLVTQMPSSISARAFKDVMAKWLETGEVERLEDRAYGFVFRRKV